MFIVLEGLDGCGKTTQAKLLKEHFDKKGYNTLLTCEPTNGRIGKFIREILSGSESVEPKTLALLFTSDRSEHVENEINPALKSDDIVICERYYHSTIAYQSAQGVDMQWLIGLNEFAIKPDITIYLDVNPETGAARTDTNEIFENNEFLSKVRDKYMMFENEMVLVDAERTLNDVAAEIAKIVEGRLD